MLLLVCLKKRGAPEAEHGVGDRSRAAGVTEVHSAAVGAVGGCAPAVGAPLGRFRRPGHYAPARHPAMSQLVVTASVLHSIKFK